MKMYRLITSALVVLAFSSIGLPIKAAPPWQTCGPAADVMVIVPENGIYISSDKRTFLVNGQCVKHVQCAYGGPGQFFGNFVFFCIPAQERVSGQMSCEGTIRLRSGERALNLADQGYKVGSNCFKEVSCANGTRLFDGQYVVCKPSKQR